VFRNEAFRVLRYGKDGSRGGKAGLPLLAAEGVMKVLRCEVLEDGGKTGGLVEVGDHVLVLGKVVGIVEPPRGGREGLVVESGLCYADGRYRSVGDVIELEKKT